MLSAADQFPLYTVPINKQQFNHQLDVPLPFLQWTMKRDFTTSGNISTASSLGHVEMQASTELLKYCTTERIPLGQRVQKTNVCHYEGCKSVCGIAPISQDLVCVTHSVEGFIWVYTNDGEFIDKIGFCGVPNIRGMVATDRGNGKLAIIVKSVQKE